ALHGDMSQGSRDGVMISFKDGRVPMLVATDIAARGLDVEKVTHVVNYDLPNSAEIYTHRIGRTGRVGRSGRAITLIDPRDRSDLEAIEKHIGVELKVWKAEGDMPAKTARANRPTDSKSEGKADKPAAKASSSANAKDEAKEPKAAASDEGTEKPSDAKPEAASSDSPKIEGDADAPAERTPRERRPARAVRHIKPSQKYVNDDYNLVIVNVGSNDGLEPADVLQLITKNAKLSGEQVRRVRVFERFSLVHVPHDSGESAAKALTGAFANGKKISAEAAAVATSASA
ncbi:MAG: DbpA RNA binding domain-containing protein, partial [Thermoleophilaceae bacterium]|nr:DbpA RNA binding domain-containing protein [Thermoleophilaceae bacterium]